MSKRPKKTLLSRTRVDGYIDIFAIGIGIATLLGFLGSFHWFLDLFSHFRVQYMQLCLPLIGIALWKRLNKRAVAIALLAMLNYALVLPYYFGKPAPVAKKPVRAMLMNINAGNGNTEQVLAAVHEAKPDILLLEEVTPKWAGELAVLDEDYPFKAAEPQDGCFGIMLLSKYPLKRDKVVEIGTAGLPSVISEIHLPEGVISFVGTHPLPPVGGTYSRHRNNQLSKLPEIVKQQNYPVLLMGDLNVTQWSHHFQSLEKNSGLNDSMKGFGFQPSWSANWFLKIPLDHALHSEEIIIHNRMVGRDVGSDHRPVIVDFTLR